MIQMQSRYMNGLFGLTWLLVCTFSRLTYANSEWNLEKQENGISVYSQEKVGSEFLQIRIEVTLAANVGDVVSAFGDGSECLLWQKSCLSSKVVKTINENEKLIYTTIDMPWPLASRDFLFHSSDKIDPTTKIFTLALRPSSELEINPDFVRGKSNVLYQVEALDEVSSKLTMLIHTDIGGDVSPIFVNAKIVDELYGDILKLKSLVNE